MAAARPRRRKRAAARAATRATTPSPSLTPADRNKLITTALELLEKLYVHLPLGVQPDHTHQMTRRDLLEGNVDLVNAAARLLDKETKYRLHGRATRTQCRVTCTNIDRVDVYLDDRPLQSVAIRSRSVAFKLPRQLGGAKQLRLFGFDGGRLAVGTRVPI
jgi:hypothetical protein